MKTNQKERCTFGRLRASFQTKSLRAGGYSVLASILVILLAAAANLIMEKVPAQYSKPDISAQDVFTLSDQTNRILSALEEDITIYLIVQDGNTDSYLTQLLERYEGASDHIRVQTVDPAANPNFVAQYAGSTIYNNSLVVSSSLRELFVSYEDLYTTNYDDYYTTGETTTEFFGESSLTSAIDYVTSRTLPMVYILEGHGETTLTTDMEHAIGAENLMLNSLSLLTMDAVPEDCSCLIILNPASDISEAERDMLLAYLENGGKLLYMSNYLGLSLPNMEAVLAQYGLSSSNGIVLEENDDYCLYGYNYYLLPDIHYHDVTAALLEGGYYILTPLAQGIVTDVEGKETLEAVSLLSSSSDAFLKTDFYSRYTSDELYNATHFDREPEDPVGSFDLAVAVNDSQTGAAVVWYGTTLLLDETIDSMVSGANEDLLLNTLGWMSGKTDSLGIRAKTLASDYLTLTSAAQSSITLLVVILVPLGTLICGLIVTIRRRRR